MSKVQEPKALSPVRRWSAMAVLTLGVLLLSIDNTVLFLAVPSLTQDLTPTSQQLLWIGDIYSLMLAGLLVSMGNLADRIGRKKLLLLGATLFGLASILAAYSPNAETLIAARALLGIAGATLMPSTLALIRNIFTDSRERTKAVAIWSAAFGAGSALGPIVGGVLLEHFWWGSVFLINLPVMLIMLFAGALLLPESKNPNPGKFDILSALLSLATMTPFVYAIKHFAKEGFALIGLAALFVAVVAGWLFARRQTRVADPMIDMELFKIRSFSGAIFTNFIAVVAMIGLFFFFSQYLQYVREYNPFNAGLAELPAAIAQLTVPLLMGVFLTYLGRKLTVSLGMALAAVALMVMVWAATVESYWALGSTLAVMALGMAAAMAITSDVILTSVPKRKAGAASAISETGFELGAVFGIAVIGSLVTSFYRMNLQLPTGLDAVSRETITDSLASAMTIVDGTALEQTVHEAFVHGMQITLVIAAALTMLAAFVAWRWVPNHVEAPAETGSQAVVLPAAGAGVVASAAAEYGGREQDLAQSKQSSSESSGEMGEC